MNKTEELTNRFNKIDTNGNGKLEKSELVAVFGEHADEFLKFCDGGEKDGVLTAEEFCSGIENDTKDMSEEDFKEQWLARMDTCIADIPAPSKDAGTLVYFGGIRSRGESCRMVAAHGGVTIKDELLTMEQWGERKSDAIPYMPYIVQPNGENLFETCDVLKHLATLGGSLTIDDKQAALAEKANSPPFILVDPYLNMPEAMWGPEAFGLPPFAEYPATIAPALKELAGELGDGPFFGGESAGYGEAFLWHNIDNMKACCWDDIKAAVGDDAVMDKLLAWHDRFAELPGIKEYLANRPKQFGAPGSKAAEMSA